MISQILLYITILDLSLQIACQMPMFTFGKTADVAMWLGFKKVWKEDPKMPLKNATADMVIQKGYEGAMKGGSVENKRYLGLTVDKLGFFIQCLNCMMAAVISLQKAIFDSPGYQKFITQKDGSMDLMQ